MAYFEPSDVQPNPLVHWRPISRLPVMTNKNGEEKHMKLCSCGWYVTSTPSMWAEPLKFLVARIAAGCDAIGRKQMACQKRPLQTQSP